MKAEEGAGEVPVATEVPRSIEGVSDERFSQLVGVGQKAAFAAKKYNPLQGLNSVAEATAKMRVEAKDFFDPRGFSRPSSQEEAQLRLSANAAHFRLSYSGLYGLATAYFVLTSPLLMFELGLISGLWVLFFKMNRADDVVTIGQYQLGRREKMLVLVPLTGFVAFFGGLISTLFYIAFFGTLLVVVHASFREPVQPDPLDALEGPASAPDFV